VTGREGRGREGRGGEGKGGEGREREEGRAEPPIAEKSATPLDKTLAELGQQLYSTCLLTADSLVVRYTIDSNL
jgi:hypothetical protein